jgi:NTP pyrophosphatase (non-canonical NTP hydrolase)
MHISEFQRWTRDVDSSTQWDLITTPQLISHLAEEVGEVAQSVNRICGYPEEREKRLANLGVELVDVFWLLAKIANRFDINLEREVEGFIERANTGKERYHNKLVSGLRALDGELSKARRELGF